MWSINDNFENRVYRPFFVGPTDRQTYNRLTDMVQGQNFSNLPKFLDRLRFSKKLLETFMGIYNDFLISTKILDSRFFARFRAFSK